MEKVAETKLEQKDQDGLYDKLTQGRNIVVNIGLILNLLGCQEPAVKIDLIKPVTIDSKIIRISGRVSPSKCNQEKAIPLAIYELNHLASNEVVARKLSKPFVLEKNQNSYAIEIEYLKD